MQQGCYIATVYRDTTSQAFVYELFHRRLIICDGTRIADIGLHILSMERMFNGLIQPVSGTPEGLENDKSVKPVSFRNLDRLIAFLNNHRLNSGNH